jgi:PAS domain S-box-containing protein
MTTAIRVLKTIRDWFAIAEAAAPLDRALLREQFRVLTNQVPILYGILVLDSISVAVLLPSNSDWRLRFAFPCALTIASVYRMLHWLTLRRRIPTAEQARVQLSRSRILTTVVSVGFSIWAVALFRMVDAELRVPIALIVFMATASSAYCLGSLPSAARLTLLIAGLPIALLFLASGDAVHISIGANLVVFMALQVWMLNVSFAGLVELVASHLGLTAESERARAAETVTRDEQARAETIAARFDTALNNMSQGLCFFDGLQRLIVSNRRYCEIYDLAPVDVRPGMSLRDIVDLRFKAGTAPANMSQDDYLRWRISDDIINQESDSIAELANGRVVRIRHRPMPNGGWVATHEDITERHRTELALTEAKAGAERAEIAARAAHTRLVEALDVVSEGLAIYDSQDRLVLWNRQYAEVYQISHDAFKAGATFEQILRSGIARGQYPDALGREERWLRERMQRHLQLHSTHEQQLPGDRWLRIEERRTGDGGTIGVRVDITELKRREASFRLLFEENPLPMWVAETGSGQFLAVNAAMCRHYGYASEQLLSMSEKDLQVAAGDRVATAQRMPSDERGGQMCRHQTSDGEVIELVIESRKLRYHGVDAHVAVAFDMTERNRVEQRIRYLAWHDGLTDLPNRVALGQHLTRTIEAARESDGSFAVLCIDLDRFKQINDLYGHAMGDQALREVARRLAKTGQNLFIARVGETSSSRSRSSRRCRPPLNCLPQGCARRSRTGLMSPAIHSIWISVSASRSIPGTARIRSSCWRTQMPPSIAPNTKVEASFVSSPPQWTSSAESAALWSTI